MFLSWSRGVNPRQTGPRRLSPLLSLLLLLATAVHADQELRVCTWNVLTVGVPGSDEYEAAYAVLDRLGADVVAIQEVASAADATYVVQLAVDLSYPHVTVAPAGPFGALRTAILADYPLQPGVSWTVAALSGDPLANDLTRYILWADVDVTGAGDALSMIVTHWKSGTANDDEYRRAIESRRVGQGLSRFPSGMGVAQSRGGEQYDKRQLKR